MSEKGKNLIYSILEYFIGAIVIFVQYKLIIWHLGFGSLGLWALILTLLSFLTIGTSGFSGSVVRYIAVYKESNSSKTTILIETIELSVAIVSILLLIIFIIIFWFFGKAMFSSDEVDKVYTISPYIIGGYFLNALSGVHLQVLDGLKLMYIRSQVNIVSKIVYLIATYFLIGSFGILGLSFSYIFTSIVTIVLTFFFMKKFIPTKRTFFLRFESKIFGDVLNYGLNFQLSSLAQIIYDPLTKFLIKKFSGVESVGLYELVSKLLLQVRQVVVVGVNILVPYIAELYEKNRILDLYFMFFKVFNFVFIITCIVLTLELFSLPFIPHFFAIKGEPFLMEKFKTYYILIAIGIAINLFSVPAYMFNMGIGKVRSNTVASIVGALSYLIFEVVIGFLWKDLGVILGWLMGSVVLSLVVQYQFSIEKKKITWDILNKDSFIVFGLTILTIFIYYCVKSNNYINFSYLIAFLYFSLVLWIVFRNPVVKNLLNKNSRNRS